MRFRLYRFSVAAWLAALLSLAGCESPRPSPAKQDARPPAAAPAPPIGGRQIVPAPPATVPPAAAGTATPSLAPLLSRPAMPGRPVVPGAESPTVAPPPIEGAVRVGLLVPLAGANASLGQAMLNAAQMAMFDWADEKFEIVVHGTGDSSESVQRAAQEAIADGAQLILGPLLAQGVRAVAPVARVARVPVVAFSSDRAVAGDGAYILGFQPESEVRRVVGYARSRGFARFAALAPDNDYGQAVVAALRQAAAGNASVTQVQFYDPNATDFSDMVRRFANYDMRRAALLAQKKELEVRDDEVAKRALARLEKMQTLGELPFDALLLPDGGRRLQAIAALLPFYDIDPAKIRMLGTGRWDQARLGAEPALVGGWYPAPPPQTRASFEQRYRQAFAADPPRLATLAYDAGALAAILGKAEKGADFSPAALTQASGFAGSDGIFRLRADGGNERGLAVLQVLPNGVRVVSPAPQSFSAAQN